MGAVHIREGREIMTDWRKVPFDVDEKKNQQCSICGKFSNEIVLLEKDCPDKNGKVVICLQSVVCKECFARHFEEAGDCAGKPID